MSHMLISDIPWRVFCGELRMFRFRREFCLQIKMTTENKTPDVLRPTTSQMESLWRRACAAWKATKRRQLKILLQFVVRRGVDDHDDDDGNRQLSLIQTTAMLVVVCFHVTTASPITHWLPATQSDLDKKAMEAAKRRSPRSCHDQGMHPLHGPYLSHVITILYYIIKWNQI